jgi:hypothetical protein
MEENPKKYLNHIDLDKKAVGNERRLEMLGDILKGSTFLPRPVVYADIDRAFKEWVEDSLKISYNDKILPTMVLYSNQRFTEYSQTWQFTDENKNLILNFKTITRDNNPEYGHIQGGLWNIPGDDRFYPMIRKVVLDDNGSESFLDLEMRQPMAIDFMYHVSIFTTNIVTINEFNMLMNDRFKARQAYIKPNEHFMPMTLENISDKSSYEINDRQFYSQSYDIKVLGYVIKEDDFRVKESPLKFGTRWYGGILKRKAASIEIEEYVNPCNEPDSDDGTYFKPITIVVTFPECVRETEFQIDTDFVFTGAELVNARRYILSVNGDEITECNVLIEEGALIRLAIKRLRAGEDAVVKLIGYDPNTVYTKENDEPEIEADFKQFGDEYEVNA